MMVNPVECGEKRTTSTSRMGSPNLNELLYSGAENLVEMGTGLSGTRIVKPVHWNDRGHRAQTPKVSIAALNIATKALPRMATVQQENSQRSKMYAQHWSTIILQMNLLQNLSVASSRRITRFSLLYIERRCSIWWLGKELCDNARSSFSWGVLRTSGWITNK